MATSRPFAFNTGSTLPYTEQVGNIAIGTGGVEYASDYGGLKWWGGPDEDLGYVITHTVSDGNQPNFYNIPAYLGFWRSPFLTEESFVDMTNSFFSQTFTTGNECKTYLNNNGYWTSWVDTPTSLIMDWDIQNSTSYNGTGTIITDLVLKSNGEIVGSISYGSSSPKYLEIQGAVNEYITTSSSLNPYLNPVDTGTDISVFLWVYPTSNGVIVSEQGSYIPDSGWYDSQIELVSGTMQFRVWGSSSAPYIYSSIATPFNNWYYVGFTYSADTLTAFINGQNAGSTTVSRQSPGQFGNGLFYNLGYPTGTNMGGGGGSTFRLGAMQVYNEGLNDIKVLQNFNSTKTTYGL